MVERELWRVREQLDRLAWDRMEGSFSAEDQAQYERLGRVEVVLMALRRRR
jgi:hypothetical protein